MFQAHLAVYLELGGTVAATHQPIRSGVVTDSEHPDEGPMRNRIVQTSIEPIREEGTCQIQTQQFESQGPG
jgi:hypothetical protein